MSLSLAETLSRENWGQAFAAPLFEGTFGVRSQKIVGSGHLKLELIHGDRNFDAIFFGQSEQVPDVINAIYKLDINDYQGKRKLQLMVSSIYGY